jgi:hypothetical protein
VPGDTPGLAATEAPPGAVAPAVKAPERTRRLGLDGLPSHTLALSSLAVPKPSAKRQRKPGRISNRWSSTAYAQARLPLAVTIPEAAELLGRSVPDVRRAAREVEPYRHADGSARWPLRELARVLADCGGVRELGLLCPSGVVDL